MPLLYSCEVVKNLTQYLIDVLRSANHLSCGHYIETFLFKNYNFNSIENLSLVTLWNYIYRLKFNIEKYIEISFKNYLERTISQLALLSPSLKLESQAIINVIEAWKGAAACVYVRNNGNDVNYV